MSGNIFKDAMDKLSELKGLNLDDLVPKDVPSNVQMMIASLGQQAFMYMGLQPNPITGETKKDLVQAKIAIDCVVVMSDVLASYVSVKEKMELETLKQNLQLNFVQQGQESSV